MEIRNVAKKPTRPPPAEGYGGVAVELGPHGNYAAGGGAGGYGGGENQRL